MITNKALIFLLETFLNALVNTPKPFSPVRHLPELSQHQFYYKRFFQNLTQIGLVTFCRATDGAEFSGFTNYELVVPNSEIHLTTKNKERFFYYSLYLIVSWLQPQ